MDYSSMPCSEGWRERHAYNRPLSRDFSRHLAKRNEINAEKRPEYTQFGDSKEPASQLCYFKCCPDCTKILKGDACRPCSTIPVGTRHLFVKN